MNIYGQLENATLEILSANPSTNVQGRVWYNSSTSRPMLDDGTNKLALFRNDQNFIFGTNATAASNIRLNRASAGLLQLVLGSDTTAEGASSANLAQLSAKHEGYAAASKPTNGNAGRAIWVTDSKILAVDDGTSWLSQVDTSTAQTLTNKTLTLPAMDIPLFTDQGSDPTAPASGKTSLYTKGGHVYKIANGGVATQLAEAGVTTAETVQLKSTTYTALTSDDVIVCSGAAWTLTLYDAVANKGKRLRIIHSGTDWVGYTLATTSAQTIGGVASGSYTLWNNGEVLEIESDGSNWLITHHRAETGMFNQATVITGTGSPAKGTSPASDFFKFNRSGKWMNWWFSLSFGTGGSGGTSGDYYVTLPQSLAFDSTYVTFNTGGINTLQQNAVMTGFGSWSAWLAAATEAGTAVPYDTTRFRVWFNQANAVWGQNGSYSLNVAQNHLASGRFPISGWQP